MYVLENESDYELLGGRLPGHGLSEDFRKGKAGILRLRLHESRQHLR